MAGSNFVDYVKIFARSGHGGAGSCHFRREKFVAFGGPDGGDGGKGGSIILQGDSQYWTLIHLKYKRHQFAEDGENGHGARSTGADRTFPERAEQLFAEAEEFTARRYAKYKKLAAE